MSRTIHLRPFGRPAPEVAAPYWLALRTARASARFACSVAKLALWAVAVAPLLPAIGLMWIAYWMHRVHADGEAT